MIDIPKKVEQFTELCKQSKTVGLDIDGHMEKKRLLNELINDGIMYKADDGCNYFHSKELGDYFLQKVTN